MLPRKSGIYQIRNIINNHRYVGSAKGFKNRWSQHTCDLKHGNHNQKFQAAWDEFGSAYFVFEIIEFCEPKKEILLEREQHYIDSLKPEYNVNPRASSRLGSLVSESTKIKLRGKTNAYDENGRIVKVSVEEYRSKNLTCPNTGKVAVVDENGDRFLTDKNHPNIKSGKWKHPSKGQVTAFDTILKESRAVTLEEFQNNAHLVGINKGRVGGGQNPNAKKIQIFDQNHNLVALCYGNFKQYCEENHLPFAALRQSAYTAGKPLYTTKRQQSFARRLGFMQYQGWYAKFL